MLRSISTTIAFSIGMAVFSDAIAQSDIDNGGNDVMPIGIGLGIGVGTGVSVDVESIPAIGEGRSRVHTSKFLCGTIPPYKRFPIFDPQFPDPPERLVPGTYLTEIEIINTRASPIGVELRGVLTTSGAEGPFQLNPVPVPRTLGPGEALSYDCDQILPIAGLSDPPNLRDEFYKGWFVARTTPRLFRAHVTGVYTLKNVVVLEAQQPPEPPPPPPKPPEPPHIPTGDS